LLIEGVTSFIQGADLGVQLEELLPQLSHLEAESEVVPDVERQDVALTNAADYHQLGLIFLGLFLDHLVQQLQKSSLVPSVLGPVDTMDTELLFYPEGLQEVAQLGGLGENLLTATDGVDEFALPELVIREVGVAVQTALPPAHHAGQQF
jgi:hypothetical protein